MGQLRRQLLMWGAIATTTAVLPGLAFAENVSPDHGGGRHGRGDRHGGGDRRGDAKLSVAGRAVSKGTTDSYGLQIRGRSGEKPTDAGGMIRFAHRAGDQMDGIVGEITCLSKDEAGVFTATGTIKRSGKRAKGDKKGPGMTTAATSESDDAFLDEIVPWDDDEAAEIAEIEAADPTVPGAPSAPGAPGQDPNKDKKDPDKDKKGPDKDQKGRRGGGELAGKDFAFTINVPAKPQTFSVPTIADKGTLTACSGGGNPVEVTRGGFRTRDAGDKAEKGDGRRGDRHGRDGDNRRGRRGWWKR